MKNKRSLHDEAYRYAYITKEQRIYCVMATGRYTTYNSVNEPIFILEDGYGFEFIKIQLPAGDSIDERARIINALVVENKNNVIMMARFYRDYINRNSSKDNKEYFYVYSNDDNGLYRFRTDQTITRRTSISSCLDIMRDEFHVKDTESFTSIKALHLETEYLQKVNPSNDYIMKGSTPIAGYKYSTIGEYDGFHIVLYCGKLYLLKDKKLTEIDTIPKK